MTSCSFVRICRSFAGGSEDGVSTVHSPPPPKKKNREISPKLQMPLPRMTICLSVDALYSTILSGEYTGAVTSVTLTPRPYPILWATLCLSIQRPRTVVRTETSEGPWFHEVIVQVLKSQYRQRLAVTKRTGSRSRRLFAPATLRNVFQAHFKHMSFQMTVPC